MAKRRPSHKSRPSTGRVPLIREASERRKLIGFEADTWVAIEQLGRDRLMTVQELADEAFADLLVKHRRPTDLRRALRASADDGGRAARRPRRH